MSERRFYLMELDEDGSMVTDLTLAITESELLRRCKAIRQPEFITEDRVIDIIVNGEGEKGEEHAATYKVMEQVGQEIDPRYKQPSPTPSRQEWEEWGDRVAAEIWPPMIFEGLDGDKKRASTKAGFLSMPGVPKG